MVADTKVSFTFEYSRNNIKNATLSKQSKLKNNLCIESVVKPLHNGNNKKVNNYLALKSFLNPANNKQSNKEPNLTTSTPKLTSNNDIIRHEINEKMQNDIQTDESTRSFLERFFDREIYLNSISNSAQINSVVNEAVASAEKVNEHDKEEENVNIKVDENANVSSKSETTEETKNQFLEFLFEFKPPASLNNSLASKKEPRTKHANKPNSDINGILIYLSNLKLKNKLNSKIVKNYLDLQKTLSDSTIRYYITKRQNCKCIENALGCCLESFSNLSQKNSSLNDLLDKCCQKCSNFEFYDYRLSDDSNSNVSETKKFETEEPDWYKQLKNLSSNNKINEALYVHNALRSPNVHEFILRSKCKCLLCSTNCCVKKIYELLEGKTDENLKEFIEYSCCARCQAEEEERHLGANIARSIFVRKLHSNSSSLDDNDPETFLNINNQVMSLSKLTEKSLNHEENNRLTKENESHSKSQIENELNTDEINKNETGDGNIQIKDSNHENENEINEVVSEEKTINQEIEQNEKIEFLDFIFDLKRPDKSLNNSTASSKPNAEKLNSIEKKENSTHEHSKLEDDKSKESLGLVKSKTSPTISNKSLLKMNNSRTRASTSSVKKSKNVTFYDEKHGFMCVPIAQWQEDLREPVYSKAKMPTAEWKAEVAKNEYEETKLRLSMSLNS